MIKYHQGITTATTDSSLLRTAAALSHIPIMGLADKYGLHDMSISNPSDPQMQTIEQEYQGYVTVPLFSTTDILKFWEVHVYTMILISD